MVLHRVKLCGGGRKFLDNLMKAYLALLRGR